jgi:hypothetical protein
MRMKISIKKLEIPVDPQNEVTSEKIFKPRRCKDINGNWRFHEKGIFSEEIFGCFDRCKCGADTTPGTICQICGCRVISKVKTPIFYIDCGMRIPFIGANYSKFKNKDVIKSLMEYKSFYYDGHVITFNLEKIDLSQYDDNKVLIGGEAAKAYDQSVTDKWIENNTITRISVPHPIYRPIIDTNNGYILGALNDALVTFINNKNKLNTFKQLKSISKFHELTMCSTLCKYYDQIVKSIFDIITNGQKSLIKKEIIGQSITGAIRAVITNRFDIDEDHALIGSEYANVLFPQLYNKNKGNIEGINNDLKKGDYHIIVNRPPTIGQLSIMAFKPIFSTENSNKFVMGFNPIVFDGYAADTDGDVLLAIGIYSREANNECHKLLPSNNYIGGSDGFVRNKIPEDFLYAMNNIYKYNPKEKAKIQEIINKGLSK